MLDRCGVATKPSCDTPEPIYSSMAPVAVKVEPGLELSPPPPPPVESNKNDEISEICDLTIAKTLALLASAPVVASQLVAEVKVEPVAEEESTSVEGIDLNGAPEIDIKSEPMQFFEGLEEPVAKAMNLVEDLSGIAVKSEPVTLEILEDDWVAPKEFESGGEVEIKPLADPVPEVQVAPPKAVESTCHKPDSSSETGSYPVIQLVEPEQHVNSVNSPVQDSQPEEAKVMEEVPSDSEFKSGPTFSEPPVVKDEPVSPSEAVPEIVAGEVAS